MIENSVSLPLTKVLVGRNFLRREVRHLQASTASPYFFSVMSYLKSFDKELTACNSARCAAVLVNGSAELHAIDYIDLKTVPSRRLIGHSKPFYEFLRAALPVIESFEWRIEKPHGNESLVY